jgi:hypothetical protein
MTTIQYLVNISYQPSHINGQQLAYIGTTQSGSTQSIASYSSAYYIASMPELLIGATGSSYTEALDNLLVIASASQTPTNPPIGNKTTW